MTNKSVGMSMPTSKVELRPTFKAKPGQYAKVFKFCQERFVGKMLRLTGEGVHGPEGQCLEYSFVFNKDKELFICRESYASAEGLIKHIENVGPELQDFPEMADTVDLQVSGPEDELKLLNDILGPFNPTYFYEMQV